MRWNVNEVWCIMFKHIYILCRYLHRQSADLWALMRAFSLVWSQIWPKLNANCWTSHRPVVWLTTTFCFKDWNTGSVYLDLPCSGSPYNSSYNYAFLWHFLSTVIFHFSYLWCTTRFCIGALVFSKTSDSSLAYFEHLWGHLLSLLCRWHPVIYLNPKMFLTCRFWMSA